ncbi:hypothetical protein AYO40_01205 [Planctomycetaceae bacterium SCGC AG-212-D15]|nr:hypothetical protein AYO40_01205 [Planctomycetaceae bacterium SCGC AG-212-D15]
MSFNGCSVYHQTTTNTTGVNIKSTRGKLIGVIVSNMTASIKFLKLYDKATAPTVGTDTPIMTIGLPANSVVAQNLLFMFPGENEEEGGVGFVNGLGVGASNLAVDSDATNTTSGDVVVNILYK